MELHKLDNFTKGWFIGNFEPTLYNTDFEVGIKEYKSGDKEQRHFHKEADEFTAIISGKVLMNGIEYTKGDIIKVTKFEDTDFECIEDCITVVIKTNSIKGDKYLI